MTASIRGNLTQGLRSGETCFGKALWTTTSPRTTCWVSKVPGLNLLETFLIEKRFRAAWRPFSQSMLAISPHQAYHLLPLLYLTLTPIQQISFHLFTLPYLSTDTSTSGRKTSNYPETFDCELSQWINAYLLFREVVFDQTPHDLLGRPGCADMRSDQAAQNTLWIADPPCKHIMLK